MRYAKFLLAITLLFPVLAFAQLIPAEGFVFDQSSGLPVSQSKVTIYDDMLKTPLASQQTGPDGKYSLMVPKVERYTIKAEKSTFFDAALVVNSFDSLLKNDIALSRKPGYVFDITIFDKAFEHNPINTLRDCKVEIYNNTTHEQELAIEQMPKSTFNFSFAEGNHYTVLVRKQGYLNRRVEVYVNVNGCILGIDGMGIKEPDLVPLMTHGNEIGYFLGTIDLDSIQIGKRFQINNIYYDFDKWAIRPEAANTLDKLAVFLKDNAGIQVELGSHTDARGSDDYNLSLSEKRAKSAVNYLTTVQGIAENSITSKGYGETQLINQCEDGADCSEQDHQKNRRTEIKIIGYDPANDPLWRRSLKEIIEDKNLYRKIIQQEKSTRPVSK
ncbi:MAG: OmpA family protein [Saprospiraceae bacterium]|nr:OmpA family protein [Saprospiraceae bacterium]